MTNPIDKLFAPLRVGDITIRNRIAFAPLPRHRSDLNGVPTDLNVEYHRQRAGGGLLLSEGTYPAEMGSGCLFTPGLVHGL